MTKVISVSNFKGGVGKTTTTVMISKVLESEGYKTLVIDLDPQANATDLLFRTYDIEKADSTLYQALEKRDLLHCKIELTDNLHLLPSDMDLVSLPFLLEKQFVFNGSNQNAKDNLKKRGWFLAALLNDIKDQYDYILIDSPPTISDFTNNAVIASDYILVVMQTQERSFQAAEKYHPYLQDMIDHYDARVSDYGVVPVLIDKKGTVDTYILEDAKESFGESLFVNNIKQRQRLKRYDIKGITNEDYHDQVVWKMYEDITNELISRLKGLDEHE